MLARSVILRQLLQPSFRNAAIMQYQLANMSVVNQQRSFAKKFGKVKRSGGEGAEKTEQEEVPAERSFTQVVHKSEQGSKIDWSKEANHDSLDAPNLPKEFFAPFSVGSNIKQVASAPNHRAPSFEDTIEGRYASALFISASQNGKLFEVYEDIIYIGHLYKHCEHFRLFTENSGIGLNQINALNQALSETASFEQVTLKFLVVLAESKRLIYI